MMQYNKLQEWPAAKASTTLDSTQLNMRRQHQGHLSDPNANQPYLSIF